MTSVCKPTQAKFKSGEEVDNTNTMFSSVTNWLESNVIGKDPDQSKDDAVKQDAGLQPKDENNDGVNSSPEETSAGESDSPKTAEGDSSEAPESKPTTDGSSEDSSAFHTLEDVSTIAMDAAKEFGSKSRHKVVRQLHCLMT